MREGTGRGICRGIQGVRDCRVGGRQGRLCYLRFHPHLERLLLS
jgi:hypothetical protein